jgi:hypothetical protein
VALGLTGPAAEGLSVPPEALGPSDPLGDTLGLSVSTGEVGLSVSAGEVGLSVTSPVLGLGVALGSSVSLA